MAFLARVQVGHGSEGRAPGPGAGARRAAWVAGVQRRLQVRGREDRRAALTSPPLLGLVVQATMQLRAKSSLLVEVVVVWGQHVDSAVVVPAIPGSPLACMVWEPLGGICLLGLLHPPRAREEQLEHVAIA